MKILSLIFLLLVSNLFGQKKDIEYYIPLELSYFPGYDHRIPWEEKLDNDTWIGMLNYPFRHLNKADELKRKNKSLYDSLSQKVLFPRKACDSLIRDYVNRMQKIDNREFVGKEGVYRKVEKSGEIGYWRCVCIPATELINIPHKQKIKIGHVYKYFEPEEFVAKFKRFKLDSFDLEEAPYLTIFPMDINPSFPCNKATTPIEKAICRSKELSMLDRELMKNYKIALKSKGEKTKEEQRNWIAKRDNVCGNKNNEEITEILKKMYEERINELKK